MDFVFHLALPLLIVYAFGIKHKTLPWLGLLAILPDLEKLFGFERSLFHNFFFVLLIVLFIFLLFHWKNKKDRNAVTGLSAFFLFSHLLLDLGAPLALLYPFDKTFYLIEFAVKGIGANLVPVFVFSVKAVELMVPTQRYFVSVEGFVVLILLAAVFVFKKFSSRK